MSSDAKQRLEDRVDELEARIRELEQSEETADDPTSSFEMPRHNSGSVRSVVDRLDDGDGADREAVVRELDDKTTLRTALKRGEVYEPRDGFLKVT